MHLRTDRLAELGNRTIDEWRAAGSLDIFHFGYGRMMKLGFDLYRDAERYEAMNLQLDMPGQVFDAGPAPLRAGPGL